MSCKGAGGFLRAPFAAVKPAERAAIAADSSAVVGSDLSPNKSPDDADMGGTIKAVQAKQKTNIKMRVGALGKSFPCELQRKVL